MRERKQGAAFCTAAPCFHPRTDLKRQTARDICARARSRKNTDSRTCRIEHIRNKPDHLHASFYFTPYIGGKHDFFCRGNRTESGYHKLANNNDYRHYYHENRECILKSSNQNKRRTNQSLICKRIQKFAQVCNEIIFSCEMSVEKIRKACNNKCRGRAKIMIRKFNQKQRDKHRHQNYSGKSNFCRQIHSDSSPVKSYLSNPVILTS